MFIRQTSNTAFVKFHFFALWHLLPSERYVVFDIESWKDYGNRCGIVVYNCRVLVSDVIVLDLFMRSSTLMNFSRVGTFNLLKANKNSCLFFVLKTFLSKMILSWKRKQFSSLHDTIMAHLYPPPRRYVAKMRIKQNHSLCCFLFRCTIASMTVWFSNLLR